MAYKVWMQGKRLFIGHCPGNGVDDLKLADAKEAARYFVDKYGTDRWRKATARKAIKYATAKSIKRMTYETRAGSWLIDI